MFHFRVEVYTGQLLISATYTMALYRRLSDALNSDLSPYIPLTDVILSPIDRPHQAQRVAHMLVDRSNILLITTLHEPEPPPDYEPPVQPTSRDVVPVMFFLPSFALQARFFKRPDMSLSEMLEERAEDFIPISDARVIPLSPSRSRSIVRDFACLSRAHIQALYALSDTIRTEPVNARPTTSET